MSSGPDTVIGGDDAELAELSNPVSASIIDPCGSVGSVGSWASSVFYSDSVGVFNTNFGYVQPSLHGAKN